MNGFPCVTSFTQEHLVDLLNNYVPNSYEFVYIPVDLYTNSNLGFGYVSLIDSCSLMTLYDAVWMAMALNE